ncbi:gephyrin-like molybdotransferase Glp [Frigidibacter sp. MR17.14]|uniref:molybdopterin molybdotransferase MoeA n=1 Tax=Frigidibacter sp. MR17.14 TaxID=3126509 RepID=UPI003012C046
MIPVAEALARVLALADAPATEVVPLRAAAGRVLAAPVIALRDQPPFAASAMDGYAIREDDHVTGRSLRVIGEAGAGHAFAGSPGPGEAVRIFTGAPVPAGAERVVLQEDVTRSGETVVLGERLETQTNIRALGQDFRAGDRIEAPRLLRPVDLALIAAMNVAEVTVARAPEVAILATGDELVMPGEDPRPDQIVASNSFALAAMAEAAGARVRMLPIARDSEASLRQSFALAAGCDLIVTIGGASVGDHDLVGRVAVELGMERAFWKVALRPGKPLMAGRIGAARMLGLPGNPVSAIVCGHLFLLPLLAAMQGLPGEVRSLTAELGCDLPANGPRAHYMRARLTGGAGLPRIAPVDSQDSARLRLLAEADALLIRPAGDGARRAGDRVDYIAL